MKMIASKRMHMLKNQSSKWAKSLAQTIFPSKLRQAIGDAMFKINPVRFPQFITIETSQGKPVQFEVTKPQNSNWTISIEHEKDFLEATISQLNTGDVFYDIGSCVGLFTINAATRGVRCIAFEPDPDTRDQLRRNVRLNRKESQVQVLSYAISDHLGFATFHSNGLSGSSPSQHNENASYSQHFEVPIETIDHLIETQKIPRANVIKIDIEGGEVHAIRGMEKTLCAPYKPRAVCIQSHPDSRKPFNAKEQELVDLMKEFGYDVECQIDRNNLRQFVFVTKNTP